MKFRYATEYYQKIPSIHEMRNSLSGRNRRLNVHRWRICERYRCRRHRKQVERRGSFDDWWQVSDTLLSADNGSVDIDDEEALPPPAFLTWTPLCSVCSAAVLVLRRAPVRFWSPIGCKSTGHAPCAREALPSIPLIFSERELFAVARLSVVCLSVTFVRQSGGWNFRQYFYGIRYLGHPLTSTKNFTESVPGEPLRTRGS